LFLLRCSTHSEDWRFMNKTSIWDGTRTRTCAFREPCSILTLRETVCPRLLYDLSAPHTYNVLSRSANISIEPSSCKIT
uniref:Ovule protein n=1 Tax=Haemonchus placei TaxID=6290 RepID=A0A0N4W3K3_HAEPC